MRYAARWLAVTSLTLSTAVLVGVVGPVGPPRADAQLLPWPLPLPLLGGSSSTQAPPPSSAPPKPAPTTPPPTGSEPPSTEPLSTEPLSTEPPSTEPSSEPPSESPSAPPMPPPASSVPLLPLPLPAPPAAPPAPRALPPVDPGDTKPGPGRAWTLTASTLKLSGSRYHGYVEQDVAGRKVKTLHFTVDRLEITDLVQRGDLGNGKIVKASGAPGSVSTVTQGPIELYTQQLTGTLAVGGYPLIPITMSPDSLALPNLDLSFLKLPILTFKNAVVHNADLEGGTLRIPGARIELS